MRMLVHEFGRVFQLRWLLVVVGVLAPLLILVCFVPKTVDPVPPSADVVGAEARLSGLGAMFVDLSNNANYANELLETWVAFGGRTDDVVGDAYGAWYDFYNASAGMANQSGNPIPPDIFEKFTPAKVAFNEFYAMYKDYVVPTPKVFMVKNDYGRFVDGIERLNELFSATYGTVEELNTARRQMTDVRAKTNFRAILSESREKFLTAEQVTALQNKMGEYEERREYLKHTLPSGITTEVQYVSYLDMVYAVVEWDMNRYVESNAEFPTYGYYGFDYYFKEKQRTEIERLNYMLENNLFAVETSQMPSGLAYRNLFVTMNGELGTTAFDFIMNSVDIALPFILVLVGLLVFWVLFWDVHKRTVVGAVASPHSRSTIIWSKITAIIVSAVLICAVFVGTVVLIGATVLSSSVAFAIPPEVIVVIFGNTVVSVTAETALWLYFLTVFVKIFFVAMLTALVFSLAIKISNIRGRYGLVGLSVVLLVGLFLVDFFMKPLVGYWVFAHLIIGALAVVMLLPVIKIFTRKEYL